MMKIVSNHAYVRAEYDWLMRDALNCVGYFSSAGAGPIPEPLVPNAPSFENVTEELKELPITCEGTLAINAEWDVTDWIDMASRGLYAYDWRRDEDCYALVAVGKSSVPGSQTSNKRNPIGPKRAPTVEEVYGPIKPPAPRVGP